MNRHLVPGDEGWREDKVLLAELSQLNSQVTRYILRQLDADAGQAQPTTAHDEQALSDRLAALAAVLRVRAERRPVLGNQPCQLEDHTEAGATAGIGEGE